MKRIDLTEEKIGRHPKGAWVAMFRNEVVAEGKTMQEAYEKAVDKGVEEPLVVSTRPMPSTMVL